MPNAEKIDAVARYKKLFEDAASVFVTDYQGLNVADMTALRKKLRESNVKYIIAKNTLLSIAASEAKIDGIGEHLLGPTAIAFSDDEPAVAAKILNDSFKDKELPRMKAFWLDKVAFDGGEIGRLADLPSKEQLYSQVVAAVEAPMTSLVRTLNACFQELIGTIDALADKKKAEG